MSPPPTPVDRDDLHATLAEAWRLIADGVTDRRSPFHTPTVATVGLDGRPRSRTVVLRAAERDSRSLRFHCDARSDKFAELGREPRVTLHVYDASAKIQVRAEGQATLHTNDSLADAAWEASRPASRIVYATEPAPGTPIDEGAAFTLPVDDAAVAAGRANFAAVAVRIETLEILHLASAGHRRSRFTVAADRVEGRWLAP